MQEVAREAIAQYVSERPEPADGGDPAGARRGRGVVGAACSVSSTPERLDYLSLEDLLEIAAGVIGPVQVRDPGLLASAAARPQASAFGEPAYSTFAEKAAALMHSLVATMPWSTETSGWLGPLRACSAYSTDGISFTVDEAEPMVVAVSAGRLDVPELAGRWLSASLTYPGPAGRNRRVKRHSLA